MTAVERTRVGFCASFHKKSVREARVSIVAAVTAVETVVVLAGEVLLSQGAPTPRR
jgi:hypothetical protein